MAGVKVNAVADPVFSITDKFWRGVPIISSDDDLLELGPQRNQLVNGIGSLPCKKLRQELFAQYKRAGFEFLSVVHPSVVMGAGVTLGEGVQIMAGAIVQADTTIGDNSIINTGALVDHDCVIGNHVHIAPGAVISGGVNIGEGVHIGTGASIIQGLTIGAGAVIGAGTVVVKDVSAQYKIIGRAPRVLINMDAE